MRMCILLLALLGIAGCVTSLSTIQKNANSFVGKERSTLYATWGTPDKIIRDGEYELLSFSGSQTDVVMTGATFKHEIMFWVDDKGIIQKAVVVKK